MMKRFLSIALAAFSLAASLGGCYPFVKMHRDYLQSELDSSPAKLKSLQAERARLEKEADSASKDSQKAWAEVRSINDDIASMASRQKSMQAEANRLEITSRKLDARLAGARAELAASSPAADANIPVAQHASDLGRLILLENSLKTQLAELSAMDGSSAVFVARSQRLRTKAWLGTMVRFTHYSNLPAMDVPLCELARRNGALPGEVALAKDWCRHAAQRLLAWSESDDPSEPLTGAASSVEYAEKKCRSVAGILPQTSDSGSKLLAARWLALSDVYQQIAIVAKAQQDGGAVSFAQRAATLKAMLSLWRATAAGEEGSTRLAAMLQTIAQIDYISGPQWNAKLYLQRRIEMIEQARSALCTQP